MDSELGSEWTAERPDIETHCPYRGAPSEVTIHMV